ncbi:MAG: LuxR family transcriptional regulator [Sulfitobacter sp.]|jgi:DNA-binding CsgD family transcriptional regulator
MTDASPLKDFVTECENTDQLADLWELVVQFFQSRGIAMISYHGDQNLGPGLGQQGILVSGYPEEWVCQYMEASLSLIDPMPDLAARLGRPFLWSEISALANLTQDQQHYMKLRAASDLGEGVALQVYGPNTRNALFCLGFGGTTPLLSAEAIFELQCAGQIAHLRYCTISGPQETTPVDLSPRELEVLRWIARGKSNSVIADILGISRHTVDTMTRRMFDKLDVNDRTTAAVRGLGSGLLHLRRKQVV